VADLRLFLDRDVGRKVGHALRLVGVEVQLHHERYPNRDSIADDVWIPEVAADGYTIVTHDGMIRRRRGEWEVFKASGARCFVLTTPTRFAHLRALMMAWPEIEAIVATEQAPYMYGLSSKGVLTPYVGVAADED
jgi:hypothetical protein